VKLIAAHFQRGLRAKLLSGALAVLPLLQVGFAYSASIIPCSASPGLKVWAIGDGYRVDPLSGSVFEQNALLFADSPSGDLSASNVVWNGETQSISLRAARNETVAFQLVVERTGEEKLTDIHVTVGDLIGFGGEVIGARNIDLYKEWYVNVSKRSAENYSLGTGWYADALIPV